MNLNDGIIRLRALEPSDAGLLAEWENDPANWRVSQTLAPYSRFAIEQYVINTATNDIYSSRELRLIIECMGQNQAAGTLDLFDIDPLNRRAGIGILVAEPFRKKGYAGHALRLIIRHCFVHLGWKQLYCNISEKNETSLALFRKQGFRNCGRKKVWTWNGEGWDDELMLQCLNPDKL